MRYGFLSDVHGDRKALERALETLGDTDEVIFLGDAVGGREDEDCVRLLRDRGIRSLCGNHDLDPFEVAPLSEAAREFLAALPQAWETEELLAIHSQHERRGTALHFVYVRTERQAADVLARSAHRRVVLGHTHEAVLYTSRAGEVQRRAVQESAVLPLAPDCRYVINVPDTRTGVVVCSPDAVEFRLFLRPHHRPPPPARDPRPVLGPDRKPRPPWWKLGRP